jgi:hypothetical protein
MLTAALFALGAAPALALPSPTVSTTGEVLLDGKARFTIIVTNMGNDMAGEQLYLYDPLPGIGIISWDHYSPTRGQVGCGVTLGNAPDPSQQVLECHMNSLAHGESWTVTVTSIDPLEPGCTTLVNEAFAYFPRPATQDHQDLPPPSASASVNLVIGLCEARMTGVGATFTAGADGANSSSSIRVNHRFEIRCKANDHRQNLEVNWLGNSNDQNSFHLITLTSATCLDDPAIGPQPPRAGFDTFIGEGQGWCNGEPASITFTFTGAGLPGTKDTAEYQIFGDACSLDASAADLSAGDQQAYRN